MEDIEGAREELVEHHRREKKELQGLFILYYFFSYILFKFSPYFLLFISF